MNRIIELVTLVLISVVLINGQFDCTFDCQRGSCNPEATSDIELKCSLWQTCGPYNAPCRDVWLWSCKYSMPYLGTINQCNQTGCLPPWGCRLTSFSKTTETCQVTDSFCSSPTKACCNNDANCDKNMHECTPTTTVTPVTNATVTTTKPTDAPNEPLNLSLIIGLSISGLIFLGAIVGFIIYRVQRRNRMQQPFNGF